MSEINPHSINTESTEDTMKNEDTDCKSAVIQNSEQPEDQPEKTPSEITEDNQSEDDGDETAGNTDQTETSEDSAEDIQLPCAIEPLEERLEETIEIEGKLDTGSLEERRDKAAKIVRGFTASAAATGALPIPLADAPLLIGQQTAMMAAIADTFSINLKKNGLKTLVYTVLGVSGTTLLGKTITGSLLKLIPGAGSIGGAAINGSTAALLTSALGNAFISVCQSVYTGQLEEEELLKKKGRMMLETAFQNSLRLTAKETADQEEAQDVLIASSIPGNDEIIEMGTSIAAKALSESDEKQPEHAADNTDGQLEADLPSENTESDGKAQ